MDGGIFVGAVSFQASIAWSVKVNLYVLSVIQARSDSVGGDIFRKVVVLLLDSDCF